MIPLSEAPNILSITLDTQMKYIFSVIYVTHPRVLDCRENLSTLCAAH